jgi:hypothetical protein
MLVQCQLAPDHCVHQRKFLDVAVQGRNEWVRDRPRNATSKKGRIVQGRHRPRDASSKGCIFQRTQRPRDASSKGRNVQGTHRPRDASSQGCIVPGMHRPRNASSKERIVQGTHRPRDASSKNLRPGTHRPGTHCHCILMLLKVPLRSYHIFGVRTV